MDNGGPNVPVPPKPWEVNPGKPAEPSILSVVQPDDNSVPVNVRPLQTPYSPGYNNNAPYAPNYYSSNYAGYSPYYNPNGMSFQLPEPFFPPSSPLSPMEQRFRRVIHSLSSLMRFVSGILQMVDSTAYAAWSSVMAAVAVFEQLRNLQRDHIQRWLAFVRSSFHWLLRLLRLRTAQAPASPIPMNAITLATDHKQSGSSSSLLKSAVIPIVAMSLTYLATKSLVGLLDKSKTRKARVMFDFYSTDPSCLSIYEGDEVEIEDATDKDGWIQVRGQKGTTGYVPLSYLKFPELESRQ